MTDKHFRDWEKYYFGYGYGTGEDFILPALRRFFEMLEDSNSHYNHQDMEKEFSGFGAWMLINFLAHCELIEYGTSPRFGWLTQKGKILRDYVLSKTPDELIEAADIKENYTCFPDRCQCERPCNNPLWD